MSNSTSAAEEVLNNLKHSTFFKRYRWVLMMFVVLTVISIGCLTHFAPRSSGAILPQWQGLFELVTWCSELLENIVKNECGQLIRNIFTAIFLIAIYCYALDNTKLILLNEPKKFGITTILTGLEFLCISGIISINHQHFFPDDFAFINNSGELWQWVGQQALFAICLALPPALTANLVHKNFAFATAIFEAMMIMVQVNMPGDNYKFFYYTLIVATISIPCFKNITCRNDYFRGAIGLSVCMLIILPLLYLENFSAIPKRYFILIAGVVGLVTGLVCFNIQWFFEYIFDLNTPLRLAEIRDNNDLLHDMQIQAPGTYSHVENVARMAHYAALRINANADLASAMAMYHDIGKLKSPQCFCENQSAGKDNPLEHLTPLESAQRLIDHVTSGLEIAKQRKLPKPVCDAIRTHHGNSLAGKFYYDACKDAEAKGLPLPNKSDFRYPYRRPETKEQVIVSLADSCEAAVRSIENPANHDKEVTALTLKTAEAMRTANPSVTDAEIQSACAQAVNKLNTERIQKRIDLINKIFIGRFEDAQLDMADVTLKELNEIKKSFIDYYEYEGHSRVSYSKL